MTSLLVLDVDNTILEKRKLDNIAYEKVSINIFGRKISMLYHPVSGKKDKDFAKHTNYEIWEYKIRQILKSGKILKNKINDTKITSIDQIDINYLVSMLGEEALKHLEKCDISDFVNILLYTESIDYLAEEVSAVGVASSGSGKIQETLLDKLEFYKAIERDLCTFGEESKNKETLIHKTAEKYFHKHRLVPNNIIYLSDSENDMEAVKELDNFFKDRFRYRGIGVLTGASNEDELYKSGADLVISNLKDKENLKKVKEYLRGLKNV